MLGEYTPAAALGDVASDRVRFVISPTAVTAAYALAWLGVPGWTAPAPWVAQLRADARDVDPRPLAVLTQRVILDCLMPVQPTPGLDWAAELERLRGTSPEALAAELRSVESRLDPLSGPYAPFKADPARALEEYCTALGAFWQRAVQPRWRRIQRILDREVLLMGRRMALDGLGAMLRELHPSVSLEDDAVVNVRTEHSLQARPVTADRPLVLVPLVSRSDRLMVNDERPSATLIAYAARGTGELWGDVGPAPHEQLAALLGHTRARIAPALWAPATTTDLAARLGLAPSTVSRHLTGLAAGGLADRIRIGPHVYYRLTARGEGLLHLF